MLTTQLLARGGASYRAGNQTGYAHDESREDPKVPQTRDMGMVLLFQTGRMVDRLGLRGQQQAVSVFSSQLTLG